MVAPHDPRAIANLMLDEADQCGYQVTNLALQKLLYFAHAIFLIEQKRPLVSGYFEAWQFGPVHPTAYQAFKGAADRPITLRATRIDVLTGGRAAIPPPDDIAIRRHVERIMHSYGGLSPGRLVQIAHAKEAPWDFIVSKATTSLTFGMRIADDVIIQRFKHHKVAVSHSTMIGEPGEDTPFA